jgi:hypothetical protein
VKSSRIVEVNRSNVLAGALQDAVRLDGVPAGEGEAMFGGCVQRDASQQLMEVVHQAA